MRIVEQTNDRMVLAGIPGGLLWMIVLTIAGTGFTIAAVWAGVHEIQQSRYANLFWIAIGLVVAQLMFWAGLVTLAIGREKLILDKSTGKGEYLVRSPIVDTNNKPFTFDLDNIDSVSLERQLQRSPSRDATAQGGSDVEVYRARLRIKKPRRAVTLLEENNEGGRRLVKHLAEQVASFLGIDFADATADSHDQERRGTPEQLATPIAALGITRHLEFPEQPPTNEWTLDIDPDSQRIIITRIKRGGPVVFGCFLLILSCLGAIAIVMAFGIWIPGQTFNNKPVSLPIQIAITIPGLVAAIVIPMSWISLFRGYRRVTVDAERVASEWIYPGRTLIRIIPGLNNIFARIHSVPTNLVQSIKTINAGDQGRVVEVRSESGRIRIGSAFTEEDQERESVVWLADAIRTAVRALAG